MITLIENATVVGESAGISIVPGAETGQVEHSFQIEFTGSPAALTFSIKGTISGVSYTQLFQHELTATELAAGTAIVHLVNKSLPKIKCSIDVLTGGTSPQVSVYYFKGPYSA